MRSPLFYFFLVIVFCLPALGQNDLSAALDLTPGISANPILAGTTRHRIAGDGLAFRTPANHAAGDLEQKVFSMLNEQRRTKGLEPLEWSDDVAAVARLHSQNMAEKKFFSHRGSDGSMVDDRADRLGLGTWRVIGENIAYMRGYEDPASLAVEKWMESTEHRKNLLAPNWKQSAVGIAITDDGTYYMTQVFLLRE